MIPMLLLHSQHRQKRKFKMQRIVSKDNNKIKRLRGLAQKKVRIKENLFLIEGLKIVEEALSSGISIDTIAVSDSFISSSSESITKYEDLCRDFIAMPDDIFTGISTHTSPQGILAAVQIKEGTLENLIKNQNPIVILDGISDPGNLGTIIRTADAFGFRGILLTGGSVDVYNPKTVQATMGSVLRVEHSYISYEDVHLLKSAGYTVYGFDLNGSDLSEKFIFDKKCVLIVGSESKGISDYLKTVSDTLIKIPMIGQTESLNAAVAAGIAMFLAGGCGRI